jgi:hypothetical protein
MKSISLSVVYTFVGEIPAQCIIKLVFVAVSECTVADSVSSSRLELEIMTWAVKQSKMGQEKESSTPGKCERGQYRMKT